MIELLDSKKKEKKKEKKKDFFNNFSIKPAGTLKRRFLKFWDTSQWLVFFAIGGTSVAEKSRRNGGTFCNPHSKCVERKGKRRVKSHDPDQGEEEESEESHDFFDYGERQIPWKSVRSERDEQNRIFFFFFF